MFTILGQVKICTSAQVIVAHRNRSKCLWRVEKNSEVLFILSMRNKKKK